MGVDVVYAIRKGTATETRKIAGILMLYGSANGLQVLGLIRNYPLKLLCRQLAIEPLERKKQCWS